MLNACSGFYRVLHNKATYLRSLSKRNMSGFSRLKFDNLALKTLPIDKETGNFTRQVPNACFSKIKPTPVENPMVVAYALDSLELLGLSKEDAESEDCALYFSGNQIMSGSDPAAHCYCGHQFGYFSGQLGDGAAIYLGEVINQSNERWEVQIKGAGKTPFSRTADGRKVLRSSIREFLCSEAMHHLGIPTTRAGTIISSDSYVIRDIHYNGNAQRERCAVVSRIAPSFIRFGSFEISKGTDEHTGRKGPSAGNTEIIKTLLDYVVSTFYPEIWTSNAGNEQQAYLEFYREIVKRTARLVAGWQCVGWCHGVLNTDNMSIVGVTIDYGPYGMMERYDPDFICNASDDGGRYTYRKQPEICKWNCMKLAESLAPIVPQVATTEILENTFDKEFEDHYNQKMAKKFGFIRKTLPEDKNIVTNFFDAMEKTGADFTNTFRVLSRLQIPGSAGFEESLSKVTEYILQQCYSLEELRAACQPRMDPRQLQMFMMLLQMNPELLAQMGGGARAVSQELDRIERLKQLKDMTQESKLAEDKSTWEAWLKMYCARLSLEAEGVDDMVKLNQDRKTVMNSANPKFVLRNWVAQSAIEAAEKGDFTETRRVLKLLQSPFSEDEDLEEDARAPTSEEESTSASTPKQFTSYCSKPPSWASDLRVT